MEVKHGMVLYTNNTPIGFGKKARLSIQSQSKHTKKSWPKYSRSGYKVRPASTRDVNKKHFNITKSNPLMNS
jgi:hypothetical protein